MTERTIKKKQTQKTLITMGIADSSQKKSQGNAAQLQSRPRKQNGSQNNRNQKQ